MTPIEKYRNNNDNKDLKKPCSCGRASPPLISPPDSPVRGVQAAKGISVV